MVAPITEKQRRAIINMRRALGRENPEKDMPKDVRSACGEITRLKNRIHKNLSIGGTINPKHSILFR